MLVVLLRNNKDVWQVAGSEEEWLEKQIESEKSISELEQQICQLKVSVVLTAAVVYDDSVFIVSCHTEYDMVFAPSRHRVRSRLFTAFSSMLQRCVTMPTAYCAHCNC